MSGHTYTNTHTHTHTYTHTHIHTHTTTTIYNPRCAHAHRGLIIAFLQIFGFLNINCGLMIANRVFT